MRTFSDPGPYIVGGIVLFLSMFGGFIIACLYLAAR